MSALFSMTALAVSALFSGSRGFGMPAGKVPSGLCCSFINWQGRWGSSWSMMRPAGPWPALQTIFRGFNLLGLM